MTDFIINNPMSLRNCILYEFTKGNEPFKTYKELMKTLGDDFMTYPEFEFWYMRFAKGNFDLDNDSSLEPEKRQITDLPVDLFEKIGDSLYFEDRIKLRLVSKDIQFRVDNWNPKVTEFTYHSFDWWSIEQNSKTYEFYRSSYLSFHRIEPNLLAEAVRILKNPKLRLRKLKVSRDLTWKTIETQFRESSTKLHVNYFFDEYSQSDYPIDIRLLAPESVEEVSLFINKESLKKMNEILQSEQCKRFKMLKISTNLSPSMFPFESFIGIPRFTIVDYKRYCVVQVAEFIKKLVKSTQLELCNLGYVRFNLLKLKELLSDEGTLVPNFPNIRRYPIQGSTDFYEINIETECISIERKS